MVDRTLADVLRELAPQQSIELHPSEVSLDELLLTLYETRFSGVVELGREPDRDVLQIRGGKVVDLTPGRYIHVAFLSKVLTELDLVSGDALRKVLELDPQLDGLALGRRLVEQGVLSGEALVRAQAETGRRRLFYLYDNVATRVVIRQGVPGSPDSGPYVIDLLPAVAYGIVVRSDPPRRRLMLDQAAGQKVRLLVPYDAARNRYGLPPALMPAVQILSSDGVEFGPEPAIANLSPEITAGLLLLFHRLNLLAFGERTGGFEAVSSTMPVKGKNEAAK